MFQLFLSVTLAATALATTFQKCSDKEPPPEKLRVSNCTEQPCHFVRGKELIAEVDFVPDHNITELKPNVQAIALGLPVEYPVPQRNACKSILEKTCPLPQNVQATYVLKIPILSIYPSVRLTVKFALIDSGTNQVVTCFKISGQVV